MAVLAKKGMLILSEDGIKYGAIYRGIMESLARFGYLSIREVMYGWDLNLTGAVDRLRYLEKSGLIMRFPSLTVPTSFYCLAPKGREAAQGFGISDELLYFTPGHYQLVYHEHHRSIVKVYLALRKIFGDQFRDWASERTLRAEEEARQKMAGGGEKRILDGAFHLNIEKTRYKETGDGDLEPTGEKIEELWRCGLEVELSLKSPERYRKQFKELARRVYNPENGDQHYHMVFFVYSTGTIRDRLAEHLKNGQYSFGGCLFILVQIRDLLEGLGKAVVERFIGSDVVKMPCSMVSRIRVVRKV